MKRLFLCLDLAILRGGQGHEALQQLLLAITRLWAASFRGGGEFSWGYALLDSTITQLSLRGRLRRTAVKLGERAATSVANPQCPRAAQTVLCKAPPLSTTHCGARPALHFAAADLPTAFQEPLSEGGLRGADLVKLAALLEKAYDPEFQVCCRGETQSFGVLLTSGLLPGLCSRAAWRRGSGGAAVHMIWRQR